MHDETKVKESLPYRNALADISFHFPFNPSYSNLDAKRKLQLIKIGLAVVPVWGNTQLTIR